MDWWFQGRTAIRRTHERLFSEELPHKELLLGQGNIRDPSPSRAQAAFTQSNERQDGTLPQPASRSRRTTGIAALPAEVAGPHPILPTQRKRRAQEKAALRCARDSRNYVSSRSCMFLGSCLTESAHLWSSPTHRRAPRAQGASHSASGSAGAESSVGVSSASSAGGS